MSVKRIIWTIFVAHTFGPVWNEMWTLKLWCQHQHCGSDNNWFPFIPVVCEVELTGAFNLICPCTILGRIWIEIQKEKWGSENVGVTWCRLVLILSFGHSLSQHAVVSSASHIMDGSKGDILPMENSQLENHQLFQLKCQMFQCQQRKMTEILVTT